MDDDDGYQMRVYRYALRGDLPREAIDELSRAHRLRNDLVEIEHSYSEAIAGAWARHPELAELEEVRDVAQAAVDEAVEAAKAERRRRRTTAPTVETKAVLAERRRALRDAKVAFREAKDRLYPVIKPLLAEERNSRKAMIKDLYAPAVADGLYWATYNEVRAHHETAMKAIARRRAQGLPADVRFHRWAGEGTLAVQLQRSEGKPARTPSLLASPSSPWHNQFALTPAPDPVAWAKKSRAEQRASVKGATVRFRVGAGDAATIVEMPVVLHRPIPTDGDVTMVRITRQRWAGRYKCFISVVVRLPHVPAVTEGGVSAVHMGWRKTSDGGIRVAVCAAPGPPPTPLRAALPDRGGLWRAVRDHGGWWEIVLPESWLAVNERVAKVRSQRSLNLETLKKQMAEWAEAHPDGLEWAAKHDIELTGFDKKRSQGWFAAKALQIRQLDEAVIGEGVELGPLAELYDFLEPWRRQDRHLWEWETNEHRQIIGRRKALFANIAAWLCTDAAVVMVDSWTPVMTKPSVGEEDSVVAQRARSNRVFASPAELRAAVENAAGARGVAIVKPTTAAVHHRCGTEFAQEDRRDDLHVWCETCRVMVDQDHNTLVQMRAVRSTS